MRYAAPRSYLREFAGHIIAIVFERAPLYCRALVAASPVTPEHRTPAFGTAHSAGGLLFSPNYVRRQWNTIYRIENVLIATQTRDIGPSSVAAGIPEIRFSDCIPELQHDVERSLTVIPENQFEKELYVQANHYY